MGQSRLHVLAAPLFAPLFALILVGLWSWLCHSLAISPLVLPGPERVFAAMISDAPGLLAAAGLTLVMALKALALAAVFAGGIAMCGALFRPFDLMVRPLLVGLQVTPVVAIAPLVVIWTGLDHPDRAVTLLAAIIAFFPIYSGLSTGLKSADPNLESLFELYGASRARTLIHLQIPSALPAAAEGFKVATGLSVIGAVVAEFVAGSGASQGLAFKILNAGQKLKTDHMIAALFTLALMALILHGVAETLARFGQNYTAPNRQLRS